MDPMVVIYLGLTVICLIVFAIIFHDKMVDRWEEKQRLAQETSQLQSVGGHPRFLLPIVLDDLQRLPNNASFAEIQSTLNSAVLKTISEQIFCRAMDVFGGQEAVAEWMTSKIPALGGNTPIDTLARKNGEEEVLKLLWHIEHGVFS